MPRPRFWLVALALLALGVDNPCHPPPVTGVIRGPYMQLTTPDAISVRWRTAEASSSILRYGPSPSALDQLVSVPGPTTEHELRLENLSPETRYYYAIEDDEGLLVGGNEEYYFETAPPVGEDRPTRIWVIGDSGTANDNARLVRNAYYDYTGTRETDVWLMLGDNAYGFGTDDEHQRAVFSMYETLLRRTAVWPTLGNHDARSSTAATQTGPFFDIFTLPTAAEAGGIPSGTEAYYSFDHANIHFVCLDSASTDLELSSPMWTWLADDLAATTQDWTIVFWHHPPYSKGSHDSDGEQRLIEMRQRAVPILEAMGVDLVLAGHSHSYERSYLLDGHYGDSSSFDLSMLLDDGDGTEGSDGAYLKPTLGPAPHEGAVYAVAGNAGGVDPGDFDHPAIHLALLELGSMVLDVDGARLDAVHLNAAGEVSDRFTVLKGP